MGDPSFSQKEQPPRAGKAPFGVEALRFEGPVNVRLSNVPTWSVNAGSSCFRPLPCRHLRSPSSKVIRNHSSMCAGAGTTAAADASCLLHYHHQRHTTTNH